MTTESPFGAFQAEPTPANAIALAIADHTASGMTDWPFTEALRKAHARTVAYPLLVHVLRTLTHPDNKPRYLTREEWVEMDSGGIRALLRALGEDSLT